MAKEPSRTANWSEAYVAKQQRLSEPLWWYHYPFLLTAALVLLLTAHLVLATNPRMGHPASLINFPSQVRPDSAVWFSMSPIGPDIVITTNDRRVFRWRQDSASTAAMGPFVEYLRHQVNAEIAAAALLKRVQGSQTTTVIAADQRLRYLHLRPVIAALAKVGVTNYALETLVIATSLHGSPYDSPSGGHATE